MQAIGARDLSRSASAALAAEKAFAMAGIGSARDVDLVELLATNPAEELIVCEALGVRRARRGTGDESVGRRALRPPDHEHRGSSASARRSASSRDSAGERAVPDARRAVAHAAQGHCLQQNLVWVLGAERRWT